MKPKVLKIKDVPVSGVVIMPERMDDEVRETHYIRLADKPTRYPGNVPVARIQVIQGYTDTSIKPRINVVPKKLFESEMHGATPVVENSQFTAWVDHSLGEPQ